MNSLFWVSRDILMGGDEFALEIRNLYQGFRKSCVILLLTNIVDSPDVGQSTCRYRYLMFDGMSAYKWYRSLSLSLSARLSSISSPVIGNYCTAVNKRKTPQPWYNVICCDLIWKWYLALISFRLRIIRAFNTFYNSYTQRGSSQITN